MQTSKGRYQKFVRRLHQIYAIIRNSEVIRSGLFYVDTDKAQTDLYFIGRNNWCLTKFPTFLSDEQISSLFYMLDFAFLRGIEIGMRESYKIVLRQKESIGEYGFKHLMKEQLLTYCMEGIADACTVVQACNFPFGKTEFVEMLSFIEVLSFISNNKQFMQTGDPDTLVFSIFDYSFNGDNSYLDFSPEKMLEILELLYEHPKRSTEIASFRQG
jgi:hypothetical protein